MPEEPSVLLATVIPVVFEPVVPVIELSGFAPPPGTAASVKLLVVYV